MKISFESTYNAIEQFVWDSIPTLSIIIGKNGVGKSQLLKLIENTFNQNNTNIPNALIEGMSIGQDRALLVSEWTVSDPQIIGDNEKEQIINQLQSEFRNFLSGNQEFRGKKKFIFEYLKNNGISYDSSVEKFKSNIPEDFYLDEDNLMSHKLGYVFREYYRNFAETLVNASNNNLPIDEEVEKFKKNKGEEPWHIFNKMMITAGLNFTVKEPTTIEKHPILLFDTQGRNIQWSNISSGEKTLIQLACWLLYTTVSRNSFPKVLLLDEPDASLHPAMVKNLLSIVSKSIIDELGVRVIMSTHSPTTVALAPMGSLYELKKNPTKIESIDRKNAIEILSDGLIIVDENTKYVFLEGKDDPVFYKKQYINAINLHGLSKTPSLNFTPISVVPPGGVEEVIKLVGRLNETGLTGRVKGIIDLDSNNEKSNTINVLSRYSIENYIFDPLLIGLSLIYKGKTDILSSTNTFTARDIYTVLENRVVAQKIVDEICTVLEKAADTSLTLEKDKITVKIFFDLNKSLSYKIPKWYFNTKKDSLLNKILYRPSSISSLIKKQDNMVIIESSGIVFEDIYNIFTDTQV